MTITATTWEEYLKLVSNAASGPVAKELLASANPARLLATEAHEGALRKYSGVPYMTHPDRVAGHLASHDMASVALVRAAFCHDVLEDTSVLASRLREAIGDWAFGIVLKVTNSKDKSIPRKEKKRQDRERLRNVSIHAKLLKLYDRLDNLFEVPADCDFAQKYAEESLLLLECIKEADLDLADAISARCHVLLKGKSDE